jgi:hypothetical protein
MVASPRPQTAVTYAAVAPSQAVTADTSSSSFRTALIVGAVAVVVAIVLLGIAGIGVSLWLGGRATEANPNTAAPGNANRVERSGAESVERSVGEGIDLTGTWEQLHQFPSGVYHRYQMVLEPAGTNTWEGTITLDTNDPSPNVDYDRNHFTGTVTIMLNSKGEGIYVTFRSNEGRISKEEGTFRDNAQIQFGARFFTRK